MHETPQNPRQAGFFYPGECPGIGIQAGRRYQAMHNGEVVHITTVRRSPIWRDIWWCYVDGKGLSALFDTAIKLPARTAVTAPCHPSPAERARAGYRGRRR